MSQATDNSFDFDINDATLTRVCLKEGMSASVDMPGTNGLAISVPDGVKEIASLAFSQVGDVQTIQLPATVTILHDQAFAWCGKLERVIAPGVTKIGGMIFRGCYSLKEFQVGNQLQKIAKYPFFGCRTDFTINILGEDGDGQLKMQLEEKQYSPSLAEKIKAKNTATVEIPSATKVIKKGSFQGAYALKKVTFHEGLEKIESRAFKLCDELAEIVIPQGVTEIGSEAFFGCTGLVRITIPDSVVQIGTKCFSGCSKLIEIKLPESLVELKEETFANCLALKKVHLPVGLVNIEEGVCSGCAELGEIIIPAGVKKIGARAFANCTKLASLVLPEGLEVIEAEAFYNCSSLTKLNCPSSLLMIEDKAFIGCSALSDIHISPGVALGKAVFLGCLAKP